MKSIFNVGITPTQQGWILRTDSNGCVLDQCWLDMQETEPQAEKVEVRVSPNPANDKVRVEMLEEGMYEIQLLNVTGQLIDRKETRQIDIFNTENLPGGVYFLRAIDKRSNLWNSMRVAITN